MVPDLSMRFERLPRLGLIRGFLSSSRPNRSCRAVLASLPCQLRTAHATAIGAESARALAWLVRMRPAVARGLSEHGSAVIRSSRAPARARPSGRDVRRDNDRGEHFYACSE